MRIAIATNGRFHVADLARELAGLGHEVTFYSAVPPKRLRRYTGPQVRLRWNLGITGSAAVSRWWDTKVHRFEANQVYLPLLDLWVSRVLEPCDVFIGMSGMFVYALATARQRYGAKIVLERSSHHILSQREILAAAPNAARVKSVRDWIVRRELVGYELADLIATPSTVTLQTFVDHGVPPTRLFRNPFGVDLTTFAPTPRPPANTRRILMVGTWSYRKGCDVLTEAWRRLDPPVELLHVGSVFDCPLPNSPNFRHIDPVPQRELPRFYAEANVFVLASREEGLAMVLAQALGCGLRVVCTLPTGGGDLPELFGEPGCVTVVPSDEPSDLASALTEALAAPVRVAQSEQAQAAAARVSWTAYAQRYENRLATLVGSELTP